MRPSALVGARVLPLASLTSHVPSKNIKKKTRKPVSGLSRVHTFNWLNLLAPNRSVAQALRFRVSRGNFPLSIHPAPPIVPPTPAPTTALTYAARRAKYPRRPRRVALKYPIHSLPFSGFCALRDPPTIPPWFLRCAGFRFGTLRSEIPRPLHPRPHGRDALRRVRTSKIRSDLILEVSHGYLGAGTPAFHPPIPLLRPRTFPTQRSQRLYCSGNERG